MILNAGASSNQSIEICVEFSGDTMRASDGIYLRFRLISAFGELPGRFYPPFSLGEVDRALASASRFVGKAIQRSRGPESLHPMRELGEKLFRALLEGPCGEYFLRTWAAAEQQDRTLRLLLDMPNPELAALPWEFLYDKFFLALSRRCSIVRRPRHLMADLPAPAQPELRLPLRILFAWADPTHTLRSGLQAECDRLSRIEGLNVDVVEQATRASLREKMLKGGYDVFHFSGNGVEQPVGPWPRQQFLSLEAGGTPSERTDAEDAAASEPLSVAELGSWLSESPPALAIFSACHTDWFAAELGRCVPFTAGVRGLALDTVCTAFSEGFYGALVAGQPVEGAVSAARQQMDWTDPGGPGWGAVVAWWNLQQGQIITGASNTFPAITETEDTVVIGGVALPKRGSKAPRKSGLAQPADEAPDPEFRKLKSLQAVHEANLQALEKMLSSFPDGAPQSLAAQRDEARRQLEGVREQLARSETKA